MYEKIWKHSKIAFGGDYNPEQWDEETWKEDMRLFRLANVDTVTLNVFSWAALQPSEDEYCFDKLDRIMEMVKENGLKVVLATSTAVHPAWMAKKYPEVLRTEFSGMKRKFGGRHNSCPNSPIYRKYSVKMAEKLAQRYQDYDNIIAWHISNEYGGECFCENCEKAFRVWLKEKYQTLDELNRVWNTAFWGHTFYDWDEVVLPNLLSEHFAYDRTMFQGISLDYRRFNSDSILECYKLEYAAVKAVTPNIPVTTNLMGFFKPLDYQKWAKYMDMISWDNYPANEDTPAQIAMCHELMRGIGQGKPFLLMEQTPSVTNWLPYNALKRPGVMRLWSYQAVAHGADSVMFFQMRRTVGACEKYHGALIDHAGHENTRVFREMSELGRELADIGDVTLGTRVPSEVGIMFDWDNWWAIEYSAGPSCLLKYRDEVQNYYTALFEQNVSTDIIGCEDDLSQYKVVIAPILYMVKPGVDEKLRRFVENGGTFITTFFSGYVDEHDLVTLGGYPGKLRDVLGIWVEESDALSEGMKNHFTWEGKQYEATLLCDLLHEEGAEALCSYEEDFYAGMPVLTKNSYGKGKAYYVAARSGQDFYQDFVKKVLDEAGVENRLTLPQGIEGTIRVNDADRFVFLLNHTQDEKEITIEKSYVNLITGDRFQKGDAMKLSAIDVAILKEERNI